MRILAIGDIHGCYAAFEALLEMIDLQPEDTLVTLGDYVDRGPDSRRVIERLLELRNECHLVPLMGNHEQMMIEAKDSREMRKMWLGFGGAEAVASYGGSLDNVPYAHWRFLEKECRLIWETETYFFVHAGAYYGKPLDAQTDSYLLWTVFDGAKPHPSGKTMICGHTSQKNGLPLDKGFGICIDTYAHGGGWLTCLDVENRWVWQANKYGQTRFFHLEAPPPY